MYSAVMPLEITETVDGLTLAISRSEKMIGNLVEMSDEGE